MRKPISSSPSFITLANSALSLSENLRTCAAISAEDVIVIVSLDMMLATSKIVAEPIKDELDEEGVKFKVHI